MFALLDDDKNDNPPCALADGVFCESAVMMTTKLREGVDDNEKRLYCWLASIWQPIELQYGKIFNKFRMFKNEN